MNDISTMNKIVEYMALARSIGQFDAHEGRVSAGAASAVPNDPALLVKELGRLLDDPQLRDQMGVQGRERFQRDLAWSRQVPNPIAAYEGALAKGPRDINLRRVQWWRRRPPATDLPPARVPRPREAASAEAV
jgi:hypothetical protein